MAKRIRNPGALQSADALMAKHLRCTQLLEEVKWVQCDIDSHSCRRGYLYI